MQLASTTIGTGPKRALLLHGLSSNGDGWWRVGPRIAELGYTVTMPDLRGHGASPEADRYLLADYAQDVLELGVEWDLVFGHSLGATTALTCVTANARFAHAFVLEDPALVLSVDRDVLAWVLDPYDNELSSVAVARDNPTWHPIDAQVKAEALEQSSRHVAERTLVDNHPFDVLTDLLAVRVPTLLLGADPSLDALVAPELGASVARQNPWVRFVTVPHSSHSIHRDEFDVCMQAIEEFLA